MAKIVVKFKEAVLKEVPLDKEVITIGRKTANDIQVDNLAVSSSHARVFKKGEQYYIEDLSSLNGTFVNGKKIQVHALNDSDVIIVGKHTLIYQSDVQTATKAAPKKRESMDETILIDAKLKDELLAKVPVAAGGKVEEEQKEIIGGFYVIEGHADQKEYELRDKITTIGKEKTAAIRLKGMFAPKTAASISRKKTGYTIIPTVTGSKGPKVNGREVEGRYDLQEGDVVEISGLKLQFFIKE